MPPASIAKPALPSASQEAQRLQDDANSRRLQNEKAHQVRLDNLGKRDPVIKKLLIAHREQAGALASARAAADKANAELERVTTAAADESSKLRTALTKANETLHVAQAALEKSQAEAKSAQADAAAARADLAAALKKAKPAGGQ